MTREFRLMLAEQGAADPDLAGCDVHRPADPRDAEIAALRMALEDLVDAAGYLLSGVGCLRGKTPEEEDWWMHERSAELELAASEGRARAALTQSGETQE